MLDIHYLMWFQVFIYLVVHNVNNYYNYTPIFIDYLLLTTVGQLAIYFILYLKNKNSKWNFLQSKKITSLLYEQKKIVQNLPDGAVIHRMYRNNES
jgi:hypothetical protein